MFPQSSGKNGLQGRTTTPAKNGRSSKQKTAKEVRLMELCQEWEIRRQKRRLDRRKWVEERRQQKPRRRRAAKEIPADADPPGTERSNKEPSEPLTEASAAQRTSDQWTGEEPNNREQAESQTGKQLWITKTDCGTVGKQENRAEPPTTDEQATRRKLPGDPSPQAGQLRIVNCYSLTSPVNQPPQTYRGGTASGTSQFGFFNAIVAHVIPEPTVASSGAAQASLRAANFVPVLNPGAQQLTYPYWATPIAGTGAAVPFRFTSVQERPIAPKTSAATCTVDIVASRAPIPHAYEAGARTHSNVGILTANVKLNNENPASSSATAVCPKSEPSHPDTGKVSVFSGTPLSSHARTLPVVTNSEAGTTSREPKAWPQGGQAKLVPREIMASVSTDSGKFVKMESICNKELTKWTAQNVADFIAATDCAANAQDFIDQEIDGKAVVLLTQEILMKGMNLRLGPAVKLYSHISNLRAAMTKPTSNSRVVPTYTID